MCMQSVHVNNGYVSVTVDFVVLVVIRLMYNCIQLYMSIYLLMCTHMLTLNNGGNNFMR